MPENDGLMLKYRLTQASAKPGHFIYPWKEDAVPATSPVWQKKAFTSHTRNEDKETSHV